MSKAELKSLRDSQPDFLSPDKHGGYICPKCGSGSGRNGTGLKLKDGRWHCFVCGLHEDHAGLYKIVHGKYPDMGADMPGRDYAAQASRLVIESRRREKPAISTGGKITEYIQTAAANIAQTDYLTGRGISRQTLDKYNVGFDPACKYWQPPTPAIVFPVSEYAVNCRAIVDTDTGGAPKCKKTPGAPYVPFGLAQIDHGQPVFLVEGETDVLSISEAGGQAIATGGTGGVQRAIDALLNAGGTPKIILLMDKDAAGIEAQARAAAELKSAGRAYTAPDILPDDLDPNDYLIQDREGLSRAIQAAINEQPASNGIDLFAAAATLQDRLATARGFTHTGFGNLDDRRTGVLHGGLTTGLYVITGGTGSGKTTFALQTAENIAVDGGNVLYFSFEIEPDILAAKLLSHYSHKHGTPLTVPNILYPDDDTQRQAAKDIGIEYCEWVAQNNGQIKIIDDPSGGTTIESISAETEKFAAIYSAPVIVIDYLQLISIDRHGQSTMAENLAEICSMLRRLARRRKLPIIAISAINRQSYDMPATLSSAKASGGIEYGADALLALQADGLETIYKDTERETTARAKAAKLSNGNTSLIKAGKPIRIQCKALKNRNGIHGEAAYFDFWPTYHYYEPSKQLSGAEIDAIISLGERLPNMVKI